MDRHLFDLLSRHGSALIFVVQMMGIFGLPIPGELLLTIAGALARSGDLNRVATVDAAIAGSVAGITTSYSVGRLVSPRVLRRLSVLNAESVGRGPAWFNGSGRWLLAFSPFIPGVRHITPIAAGSASLDFRAFAAYAYPGAVLWSMTFVAAGYYGGDDWRRAAAALHAHVIGASLVFTVLAVGSILVRRRTRH
jgi:membrane protein DedA with SNARE-associated domain